MLVQICIGESAFVSRLVPHIKNYFHYKCQFISK